MVNGNGMGEKMTADIRVYCDPKLKDLAYEAADREGVPLSELVVKAIVKYIKAPRDLEKVPRISFGRPRKREADNGHKN